MKRVNIWSVRQGTGELVELYLEGGSTGGRLLCPQNLIPAPGQYLLAQVPTSDPLLPVPVFNAGPVPGGFLVAPPVPQGWQPGTSLSLHGPLGRGFSLPASARRVALVPLGDTFARLKPLLPVALEQDASVTLISDLDLPDLPPEVEVQPVSMLAEITKWADYLAIDLPCGSLPGLREMLGFTGRAQVAFNAQALVVTPMPCGGLAECGVCAFKARGGWKMACKDGPVFSLKELL